jgi:hypothetical protein
MKIFKGEKRIVIALPSWGIVVKFPIIRILKSLFYILSGIKKSQRNYVIRFLKGRTDAKVLPSLRGILFGGILENWREFVFFLKTEHPFLQETYFSLFGFINIQKLGKPTIWHNADFENAMKRFLGDDLYKDPHHFSEQKNFSWEAGRLKICDYGSLECREVIEKHGAQLYEEFARS